MKTLSILASISFACAALYADFPAAPVPRVTTSSSGCFIFKALPAQRSNQGTVSRSALGVAYKLLDDGSFSELWRVEGWYASEIFLSDDGQYLVRMGNWPSGFKPSTNDLAVAFYGRGKLLSQFSTDDLVKDKTKIHVSSTHYRWRADEIARLTDRPKDTSPWLDCENKFHLKTCDGIEYIFDVTKGKIVETKRD